MMLFVIASLIVLLSTIVIPSSASPAGTATSNAASEESEFAAALASAASPPCPSFTGVPSPPSNNPNYTAPPATSIDLSTFDFSFVMVQNTTGCSANEDVNSLSDSRFDALGFNDTATRDRRWAFDETCNSLQGPLRQGIDDMWTLIDAIFKGRDPLILLYNLFDYWMGDRAREDFDAIDNISSNINELSAFYQGDLRGKFVVRCDDYKKQCGGRTAGYAWNTVTPSGATYANINMCDIYYNLDDLETSLEKRKQEMISGDYSKVTYMGALTTKGSVFLHEVMHSSFIYGSRDRIDDQCIPDGRGVRAYGATNVYRAAHLEPVPNQVPPGYLLSSMNADSYTMLINTIWWWGQTGEFPGFQPGHALWTMSENDYIAYGNCQDADIVEVLYFENATTNTISTPLSCMNLAGGSNSPTDPGRIN